MKKDKNIHPIFAPLVGGANEVGTLNRFIKASNYTDSNEIRFQDIIDDIAPKLLELADLEEIILQTRAWKGLTMEDIKLVVNNGYIYARAPFYRRDVSGKELRVTIGKHSDWAGIIHSDNLEDLYEFQPFMQTAYSNLTRAMSKIIMENINHYKRTVKQTV